MRLSYWCSRIIVAILSKIHPYGLTGLEIVSHLVWDMDALVLYFLWAAITVIYVVVMYQKLSRETVGVHCKSAQVTRLRKWLHSYISIQVALGLVFNRPLLVNAILGAMVFAGVEMEILRTSQGPNNILDKIFLPLYSKFGEDDNNGKIQTSHLTLLIGAWVPILASLSYPSDYDVSIAMIGIVVVGVADSMAAIIGSRFPSLEYNSKSIQGTIAHFTSTVVLISAIVYVKFGSLVLKGRLVAIVTTGLLACLTEVNLCLQKR
ncbi:Polyprenol kinase family [Babesia duncani]|uniref:dolichol kinase n=1 Tax=Babesia duncani TaxID=323732 RepID=A0AAD9PID9_9APIC|nr:Polyprenol kinase family [Babesia duncani]